MANALAALVGAIVAHPALLASIAPVVAAALDYVAVAVVVVAARSAEQEWLTAIA